MAKRGQRLGYRTVFTYPPSDRAPGGINGRVVQTSEDDATRDAKAIARRGGTAHVVRVAENGAETVLAAVTPDDITNDEE